MSSALDVEIKPGASSASNETPPRCHGQANHERASESDREVECSGMIIAYLRVIRRAMLCMIFASTHDAHHQGQDTFGGLRHSCEQSDHFNRSQASPHPAGPGNLHISIAKDPESLNTHIPSWAVQASTTRPSGFNQGASKEPRRG